MGEFKCERCGSISTDPDARFCENDGTPLVPVNNSSEGEAKTKEEKITSIIEEDQEVRELREKLEAAQEKAKIAAEQDYEAKREANMKIRDELNEKLFALRDQEREYRIKSDALIKELTDQQADILSQIRALDGVDESASNSDDSDFSMKDYFGSNLNEK